MLDIAAIDAVIFGVALIANLWALVRRPDWVAGTLLIAMLASIPIGQMFPAARLVGILAVLDAIVAFVMLLLWTYWRSRRAQLIGNISLIRSIAAVVMATAGGAIDWTAFAIFQNAMYALQLLIAGGWIERMVTFFDNLDPSNTALRGERAPNGRG